MSGPVPPSLSPAAAHAVADRHHPEAFRSGLKVGTPSLFGIAAWGFVVGIAMVKSGLSVPQALGMTLLVFAGSAQLAALPLLAAHAPTWVIFVTALVINLRFVIFSALLASQFSHLPWRQRLLVGYVSGDLSVALFLQRYPVAGVEPGKLSYLKGLLFPNWSAWQVGSIAGIVLGAAIPADWGLEFAGTLAIICVMVQLIAGRAVLCGVLVAGAVALVTAALPYKLGLLVAVIVGMLAAMATEELSAHWRRRSVGVSNQGEADV